MYVEMLGSISVRATVATLIQSFEEDNHAKA
ncbi:hypothetical protein MCEMIEM13_02829 [Comamonadaceae bacterium]